MRLIDKVHLHYLKKALERTLGNKGEAAEYLGISVRTLRLWEIKFGLREKQKPTRTRAVAKEWCTE